jgi:hypothetical protein
MLTCNHTLPLESVYYCFAMCRASRHSRQLNVPTPNPATPGATFEFGGCGFEGALYCNMRKGMQ